MVGQFLAMHYNRCAILRYSDRRGEGRAKQRSTTQRYQTKATWSKPDLSLCTLIALA